MTATMGQQNLASYLDLVGPSTGSGADATAIINQTLSDYGLQGLSNWAWNEITNGASADQVLVDMYQTPQFAHRFPGIIARQKAGLPPISPANYIAYEDQAKQLENQYALPAGFLSNPQTVGNLIGQDVSATELTDRIQNGYAAVVYAPPAVRQAYASMFGAHGDGALVSQFLDTNRATDLLTKQATAAQISGQASMGGINMNTQDALALAQEGQTQSSVGTSLADLQQKAGLYNASINEQPKLAQGTQGVEAEFGLSGTATTAVQQREQQRQAQFQGGGGPLGDQYGQEGAGAARPF